MKRRASWLVMPVLLVFAGPAGAVLIDFETYPDASPVVSGTEVTNQFASLGVSFSSVASPFADQITNIVNWVETTSQFNVLAPGGPAPYHGGQLILSFSPPASVVGSYFVDDQIPVEVVAFDINNAVVGVAASDGTASGFDNWSIAHQAGIARVEMTSGPLMASSPDGWGIDDLEFTLVPEPVTLLSAGIALCGSVFVRRRLQQG